MSRAYGHVPKQRTPFKRRETSKHTNLRTSPVFSDMFTLQRKKRHCCLCRELTAIIDEDVQTAGLCPYWRRMRQYDESGGHPTANEQVNKRSARPQCCLHSQLLVNSWHGVWKINGKMILPQKKTAREQLYSRYASGIDVARRTQ